MATPCPIERSIGCPMGWSIGTLGALERHESHVVEAVEFAKAPVVWCYEPAFMWWVPYTKMVSSWHKVRERLPTNMELSFQLLVKHKIWINTRNGIMLCYSNGDDSCQWYVWGTMKPWPFFLAWSQGRVYKSLWPVFQDAGTGCSGTIVGNFPG